MHRPLTLLGLAVATATALAACADHQRAGRPTTVTSAPQQMPGSSAPASPAESWSTEGGPATPGAPSSGDTVDPAATNVRDGGLF